MDLYEKFPEKERLKFDLIIENDILSQRPERSPLTTSLTPIDQVGMDIRIAMEAQRIRQSLESKYIRPQIVDVVLGLEKDARVIAITPLALGKLERAMFAVGAEEVEFEAGTYQRIIDKVTTLIATGRPVRVLQYQLKQ